MLRILAAVTLAIVLFAQPASAEAPACHPLSKGASSIDLNGHVETECWPLVVVGGLASDHH
jgi:hypothetical protein